MRPLVEVNNVSHAFGAVKVLDGVSLTIAAGSYTVLLGPSGSGKTTLLSILGGFLRPSQGRVLIAGQDCTAMPPAKRPTATVFQDYALFPHMTVGHNVAFGLRMRGVPQGERLERARAMLEVVGLAQAFAKRPHELSGGQRQRVALARALVVQPAVLLLDEPLGALDLKLRRQMQDELKAIQRRVGTGFIHVTHDQEEAMALADHVVVMNVGHIEDQGPPQRVYREPATGFTATFMGESTILSGEAQADGAIVTALGRFKPKTPQGAGPLRVAIRPEDVRISTGTGAAPARIRDVVFQGSFTRVVAALEGAPDTSVLARLPAGAEVAEGDLVSLEADAARIIVLRD